MLQYVNRLALIFTYFIALPEKVPVAKVPENISFQEAATIPTGGFNALYFLRKAKIQPGDHLLINGNPVGDTHFGPQKRLGLFDGFGKR